MTTMISHLPRDLIEEILSRVPSKSMRQVRLTCKKWDTLSRSGSFSKMHIGREASAATEGESQIIVLMDNTLHLMNYFVDGDPRVEPKGKLCCVNEQVKISQVYNCEGLLLCILEDDTKVVVWNPYSGQTRWIGPRYSYQGNNGCYTYALGYVNKKNESSCSHKILRFFEYLSYLSPENRFLWYEIYDFDTDLWTTIDVPSEWSINFPGLSLKGNTYFCATKANSEDELNDHLICFDYTSERFGPALRFPFNAGDDDYVTLSCVREEKLAVLLSHNEYNPHEFDIWITTKIEPKKVSWSKFLTLNTKPYYPITPPGFFIDEGKKVAMGFDEGFSWKHHVLSIVGEAGYSRRFILGYNIIRKSNVFSYVPSPVQIKKAARGKRKKQSYLEKRRYDEKMLRLAELENMSRLAELEMVKKHRKICKRRKNKKMR